MCFMDITIEVESTIGSSDIKAFCWLLTSWDFLVLLKINLSLINLSVRKQFWELQRKGGDRKGMPEIYSGFPVSIATTLHTHIMHACSMHCYYVHSEYILDNRHRNIDTKPEGQKEPPASLIYNTFWVFPSYSHINLNNLKVTKSFPRKYSISIWRP